MSAKVVVLRGWGLGGWGLGDSEGAGANILIELPVYQIHHTILLCSVIIVNEWNKVS